MKFRNLWCAALCSTAMWASSAGAGIIHDNTPTGTVTEETRGPATSGYPGGILTRLEVGGSDVTINQFGTFGRQEAAGNVQFAIFDDAAVRLYLSPLIAVGAAGGVNQWYDSPLFSLTLLASEVYYLGLVSDQSFTYTWSIDSLADTQDGLTSNAGGISGTNGNFGDIGDPQVFDFCCVVQQSLRVAQGAEVPEPGPLPLIGLALSLLLWARRRNSLSRN